MLNEKELLEQLVAESNSYAEILRKLGKSNSGKKLKIQKYCPDCHKPIGNNSTYCRKCGPKHTNLPGAKVSKENRPSKEELFELIKTKSFAEIGRMYGVSDSAIKKWCVTAGLPNTKVKLKEYLLNNK